MTLTVFQPLDSLASISASSGSLDRFRDGLVFGFDVGTGSIDFTKLFAQAKKAGLKNYFIEQETYPVNSMQSIENSIKYIKTIR